MIRVENRSRDNCIHVCVYWGVSAGHSCDFYSVEKSQSRYNMLYGSGVIVDHSVNRAPNTSLEAQEEKYQAHGIALAILREVEHLYPRDTIPRPGREREPMQAPELPTPVLNYRPPYGQLNRLWRMADDYIDFRAQGTPIRDEATPIRDEATPTRDEATPTRDEATPTRDEATPTRRSLREAIAHYNELNPRPENPCVDVSEGRPATRYDPRTRSYEMLPLAEWGRERPVHYAAYGDFVSPRLASPEITEAENRG